MARRERRSEDLVLREEAGEREEARDRERRRHHRQERLLHLLFQPAHPTHVLLASHRVDHGAGTEEEARLEERVREDVEHPRRERADAAREEHVAELRDRGVREDALDVVLREPDRGSEDRRPGADPGDERQRVGREHEERARPADEVDAGRHHRRRVDQRGDGRRARHRIGQPDVERELRALAARAEEEEEARRVERDGRRPGDRVVARHLDEREVGRAEEREDAEDAEDHAEVPDPVRHERLLPGRGRRERRDRRVLVVVVSDQEIRAEPDALPPDEEHRQVVRQDEDEHREHEEVEVGEEAPVPRLLLHVPDAVDVDQRPDERDEREHQRRQHVEPERDVDGEAAGRHPLVDALDDGSRLGAAERGQHVRDQDAEREDRREPDGRDADDAVDVRQPSPVASVRRVRALGRVRGARRVQRRDRLARLDPHHGVLDRGADGVRRVLVVLWDDRLVLIAVPAVRVGGAPCGRLLPRAEDPGRERDEPVQEEAEERQRGDEPERIRHAPFITTSGGSSCRRRSTAARGRARRRSRARSTPRPPRRR